MTISFLSGAYKNAGDFLIEKRAIAILNYVHKDIIVKRYLRSDLISKYDEINRTDAIVIGGGPLYAHNIGSAIPLEICLKKITKPIMIFGCGWYGTYGSHSLAANYKFTQKSFEFLKKVDTDGFGLGCRDIHTVNALKSNGFENVVMTGCPAWYNLAYIDETKFRQGLSLTPNSIIISDPALPQNYDKAVELTEYIRERYPQASIKYALHRGMNLNDSSFQRYYKSITNIAGVEICDISDSADGFHLYDNCDLHIGFRVHAHIYNLSIRNKTILIEEDGRGAGVNETLGLLQIKAYSDQLMYELYGKISRRINAFSLDYNILQEVATYLELLDNTGNMYLENAFRLQKAHFKTMCKFIEKLKY